MQTGGGGTQGHRKGQNALRSPHRVHAPCQHLCNVGLDVLEEQLVISQEAVEDTRVIIEVSFLSQVQVKVLGVFFSCGWAEEEKRVRLSTGRSEGMEPW